MLIAIDVGNTNTVIGLFCCRNRPDGSHFHSSAGEHGCANSGSEEGQLLDHWRVATSPTRTSDEWLLLVREFLSLREVSVASISGVVIASVVPTVTVALRRMCERVDVSPLVVNWQTSPGMPIKLANPAEIGADRIANGIAAYELTGKQTVVVDLGTATTFDVVSVAGEFVGGVIIPGIEISLNALFERAAALGRIELTPPEFVVGNGTINAIRSGATYGFAAQIDGVCERIQQEIGDCEFIATGGLSSTITPLLRRANRHEPLLTLEGLQLIWNRTQA